jgi:hypothetical protein
MIGLSRVILLPDTTSVGTEPARNPKPFAGCVPDGDQAVRPEKGKDGAGRRQPAFVFLAPPHRRMRPALEGRGRRRHEDRRVLHERQ